MVAQEEAEPAPVQWHLDMALEDIDLLSAGAHRVTARCGAVAAVSVEVGTMLSQPIDPTRVSVSEAETLKSRVSM